MAVNLITTHKNGDFDALAAVVAASRLYPGCRLIVPEPLQANVRSFINLYRHLLPLSDENDISEELDTVIVVDTNKRIRLGKWARFLDQAKKVIVFDHHSGEQDLGADLIRIEDVGATTTILLEEIIKKKLKITDFEATLFALGIYEDTGCMTYDITTSRDARVMAYLWKRGLNTNLVQEYLRSPLSESQKQLLERLMQNSELYELNQRRVLISTTVLDEYVSGAAVIIQLLDEIEDTGLTIIIVQMTDNIYLAARSSDNDLNLLELLAPFDVKGYPGAVSTYFKGFDVEKIKKAVMEFLKKYLPPVITAEMAASKPVITVTSDTSIKAADQLLAEHGIQGCPVIEEGKLAGIISRRDLRKGLRSELGHAPVKGFMTRKPITASPNESLIELRRLIVEHDIGRVPIVNKHNKLVGIVTRSDILKQMNFFNRKGRSLKTFKSNELNENIKAGSSLHKPDNNQHDQDHTSNLSSLLNKELPARMQKLFLQIMQLAGQEKVQVYLVGGTIRDLLLRYPLAQDLDFVVVGDAVEFAFRLQKLVGGKVRYFEQFGTASLHFEDGLRLDLATARKEYYDSPAALPRIASSSLKDDLFRRDFTINTMACSITADSYGLLYDYYNGREDLQNHLIRVLYKLSFVDDPLRILRAIRFEQRYDFQIEPETLSLLTRAVERRVLEKVSRQRLNQELRLIYREPSPFNILKRFEQLGFFSFLFPRVYPDKKTWKLLSKLENINKWIKQSDWMEKPDYELLYLGGLLVGLESVERSAIIRKLNISRERASTVFSACQEVYGVLEKLNTENINPSEIVGCLEQLPLEAVILALAMAENEIVKDHLKHYLTALKYIRPSLKGSDLRKLGLEPGPRYKKIINGLKKAILDGEVRTPQEELDYVIYYLEGENKWEEC